MKHELAMTSNVRRFLAAVRELRDRSLGVEGMGLLWGQPGEGKSTTVAFAANTLSGVFVRANAAWTMTSMLAAIMTELGHSPLRFRAPMVDAITRSLMADPRPVFVDEADYLLRDPAMLDTLRDIYDVSGSPIVLIGMEDMARKVRRHGRTARRITQWVEFSGISDADTRILADTVCEVQVADDLLAHIRAEADSNIGRMTTALSRVETLAKTNGLTSVDLAAWGDRALFYDQPTFRARRAANGR